MRTIIHRLNIGNRLYKCVELGDKEKIPVVVVGLASNYEHLLRDSGRLFSKFRFILADFDWTIAENDEKCVSEPLTQSEIRKLTLDDYVDNYESLRQQLNLDKIIVMGHSRPAWAAVAYLEKYPEHTLGCLVMHCPAIWIGNEEFRTKEADAFFDRCADQERQNILKKNWAALAVRRQLSPLDGVEKFSLPYIADTPKNWFDPLRDCPFFGIGQGNPMNTDVFGHFATRILTDSCKGIFEKLKKVRQKIFLIQGLYDFGIPISDWVEPDAPMQPDYIAEKSGHLMLIEEPEEFEKIVFTWIDSLTNNYNVNTSIQFTLFSPVLQVNTGIDGEKVKISESKVQETKTQENSSNSISLHCSRSVQ